MWQQQEQIDPAARRLVARAFFLACAPTFAAFREEAWERRMRANFQDYDGALPPFFLMRVRAVFPTMPDTEIAEAVRGSPLLRLAFAKDPGRQGIDEGCQLAWLQRYGFPGYRVVKLPQSGPHVVRLAADGSLLLGAGGSKKDARAKTKALDFFVHGLQIYIYAKHTGSEGGSQDNQLRDAEAFLRHASEYCGSTNDSTFFLALLDGGYYDTRRKSLRATFDRDDGRVRVRSCDELAHEAHD